MKNPCLNASAVFVSFIAVSGCSTFGLSSHSVDYDTPKELIENEFSKGRWVDVLNSEQLNPFSTGKAKAPYETLKKYCEDVQEGTFRQKEEGNPFYGQNPDNIKQKTGLFECISSRDIWYARINTRIHKGPTLVVGAQGFYISASYAEPEDVFKDWATEKQKETEEFQRKESIREAFSYASSNGKVAGQKICTMANEIGFVEKVVGDKIKVDVKGHVDSKPRGFFFDHDRFKNASGDNALWTYRVKDEYAWSDSNLWGQCNFEL